MFYPKSINLKTKIIAQIILCLVLLGIAIYMSVPAYAQDPTLRMARVAAPDINCIFDQDCTITVSDSSAEIVLPNTTGAGFLQSRLWPEGELGTDAQGLYAFLYRIDLREISALEEQPCILSMAFDFGPLVPIDYDSDEQLEDYFVIVEGAIGTVAPQTATQIGDRINLDFGNGICVGDQIEQIPGQSSVFIGFTSRRPNRASVAAINITTSQDAIELDARTPQLQCERIPAPGALPEPTLITFEELPNATVIDDSYRDEHGILFENSETNRALIYGNEPEGASSPPNTVSNSAIFPNTSVNVPLQIQFDNPQSHVGFYIGNGDGDAVTGVLTAFTADGKPLCSFAYPFVPDAHTTFAGIHNPDGLIQRISLDYGATRRNESIDDLYFVAAPQPDLVVDSLTIDEMDGNTISYSYVLRNIGTARVDLDGETDSLADDVTIQTYLSQDEIFNNDDDVPFGGTIVGAGLLEPGQSIERSFTGVAEVDPNTFAFLTLMVDFSQVVAETNEENNTIAASIPAPPEPLPDLTIELVTVTSISSNSISAGYRINNIGEAPVDLDGPTDAPEDDVVFGLYLSQNETFEPDTDIAIGTTAAGVGELAAGSFRGSNFSVTTEVNPFDFPYLIVVADLGNLVEETNEENNSYSTLTDVPRRIRACRLENNECIGQPDAMLYRVDAGGSMTSTMPLDENGYAMNPGRVAFGTSYWARQKVEQTGPLADVGSATLYHTSGLTPTVVVFDSFANGFTLNLYLTDAAPLLTRDIQISAQWTPTDDPAYEAALRENLRKTSDYLHDFTDGQFALGNITIHQGYDEWDSADIRLYADNNQRPLAVVGGMVDDITVDISATVPLTYANGHIYMGSQWNRYFEPAQDPDIDQTVNIDDDWALALGHEISHYSLFLWDTYFGIVDREAADGTIKKRVEPINTCTGSAMGYLYDLDNTEFIFDADQWSQNCAATHAYSQTNGARTEWDTIQAWYPWSIKPTKVMTETSPPPIDLTTINFVPPSAPVTTLLTQTFDLLYTPVNDQTVRASDRARAYLIRGDRIIEQGQPPEASSAITLTGAAEGDRFCLFDIKNVVPRDEILSQVADVVDADTATRHQFGCKIIDAAADEEFELALERDVTWEPVIELEYAEDPPVEGEPDEVTITVDLAGAPLNLKATIYPEHDANPTETEIFAHDPVSNTYSVTVTLPQFTPSLYLQLWATDDDAVANETNPRREAIVGSGVKGAVVPGPAKFATGAPIVSPKGDLIIFFNETISLGVGEFIAIQETYAIPPLPAATLPLNNISGYRLTARPNSLITGGSVSLRYLPPPSGPLNAASAADELPDLTIYQWNGDSWTALDTSLSREPDGYILANALFDDGGIFALLENVAPDFVPDESTAEPSTYLPVIVNE